MTDRTRKTVAIVDNALDPTVYRPVDHWSRYLGDVPWQAFTAREGCLPDPAGFSHLILTGSEASIVEREPWAEAEARFAREAVAGGAVVLGSCWGHQLLAYALAGEAHVRRAVQPEIGWIEIRLDRSSDLLGPAGTTAFTFSSHFDEVCDLPPAFTVLASSDLCAVEAFHWQGRPVWGLQCHPEIDVATGGRFLRDLVACGFRGQEAIVAALGRAPQDSGLIEGIVRAFLVAEALQEGKR